MAGLSASDITGIVVGAVSAVLTTIGLIIAFCAWKYPRTPVGWVGNWIAKRMTPTGGNARGGDATGSVANGGSAIGGDVVVDVFHGGYNGFEGRGGDARGGDAAGITARGGMAIGGTVSSV